MTVIQTLKMEAGRNGVQGHPHLYMEFEVSLGYMRPGFKTKTMSTHKRIASNIFKQRSPPGLDHPGYVRTIIMGSSLKGTEGRQKQRSNHAS